MPGKIRLALNVVIVGIFSAMPIFAQDVFVKDSLRVGVRTEPGNDAAPVSVVTTGMKLTILESSGNYIKIKSKTGVTGWVKKTYVSPEPPARVYLQQLQGKFKQQGSELSNQSKMLRAAELNTQSLNDEISKLKKYNAELQTQLDDERNESLDSKFSYLWKFILFIAICVTGFFAGIYWHRSYAMKRLGGLRV